MRRAWLFVVVVACGKSEPALTEASWSDVCGETRGMKFCVSVPDGLPENKEAMLGRDWWVGIKKTGPRLSLEPKTRTVTSIAELQKLGDIDPKRADMTVLASEVKPDGRVRFVHQSLFGGHLNIHVWIPKDATRGMMCTGDWWYGVDGGGKGNVTPPPDPKHLAMLERFCASVKLP